MLTTSLFDGGIFRTLYYPSLSQENLTEENILSLIRQIALDGPQPFPNEVNKARYFIELINLFFQKGGNPNFIFQEIKLDRRTYRHVSCFHLVYLYWKQPVANGREWDSQIDQLFENLIDRLLEDRRTDVRAKFTEHLGCSEHFCGDYYYHQAAGYLLERATIAHYAMAIEDLNMVEKVLEKSPDLLQTTCCLTRGKNLLSWDDIVYVADLTQSVSGNVFANYCVAPDSFEDPMDYYKIKPYIDKVLSLDDDDVAGQIALVLEPVDDYSGILSYLDSYPSHEELNADRSLFDVIRTTKVTLLHLAARLGNERACGYLFAKQADRIALDSEGDRPLNYFQLSLSEGCVKQTKTIKQLCQALEPVVRLNRPYLPPTCCILKRDGYDNVYDTRTRVSAYVYERLTKESLQRNTTRENSSFKVDRDVPQQNRAKHADYQHSGYDRGHLTPAADALVSQQAMEETFLLTNISPQHPQFNHNYWKALEKHVRTFVGQCDLVEVFTGCLFIPQCCADGKMRVSYEVIGSGHVAVPTHFFKLLYLHKGRSSVSRAYILPNQDIPMDTPLTQFEVTVNDIQRLSGILFNQWN